MRMGGHNYWQINKGCQSNEYSRN